MKQELIPEQELEKTFPCPKQRFEYLLGKAFEKGLDSIGDYINKAIDEERLYESKSKNLIPFVYDRDKVH
ncbi:MAG: hypothetical protein ACOCUU_03450 [Nanoarchaeota archaeon]